MNVVLINPTPPDLSSFGVRSISAYLKSRGNRVRVIFLPGGIEKLNHKFEYIYQYPKWVIDEIVDLCRDCQLIGISFLSHYYDRALQITNALKKALPTPIIWGGIHPTTAWQKCLEDVDYVCIGEGELALQGVIERLENGKSIDGAPNIMSSSLFRIKGCKQNLLLLPQQAIPNWEYLPLVDLNKIPHFDWDTEGHFILDFSTGHIEPLTSSLLKKNLPLLPYFGGKTIIAYRTLMSRGCPHSCKYCANSILKNMFPDQRFLRVKKPELVAEEINQVRQKYPFIQAVQFFDDTFFGQPMEKLQDFCRVYKERVGLPFYCQASPSTLNEEKLKLLLDAGMVFLEMGIQSGSEKTKFIFNRRESNQKILECVKLVKEYQNRLLKPNYHLILDNPWENWEDVRETLQLLLKIPRPYKLCLSTISFFPGTELYYQAKEEGLISDDLKDIVRKPFYKPKPMYLNYLIYLCGLMPVPRWLIKFASAEFISKRLHKTTFSPFISILWKISRLLELVGKGLYSLFSGDIKRILAHQKRAK